MGWERLPKYQKTNPKIETIAARVIDAPKPVMAAKKMMRRSPKMTTEMRENRTNILRTTPTRMPRANPLATIMCVRPITRSVSIRSPGRADFCPSR